MAATAKSSPLAAARAVEGLIVSVRGQRVLLGQQLATLYAVETRVLMQAVQRNRERFPSDFMFELSAEELAILKSQNVISSSGARWGGLRKPPFAFTEQGVAMLSSVLRSKRAVAVNIEIMRAFVKLRSLLEVDRELARKLGALEQRYDQQFRVVFDAIRELMATPSSGNKRRIGFY